jgi:hypothetical protein
MAAQSYANHRRFVPAYHFVIMPLLLLNVVMMGYGIYQVPDSKMNWWHLFAAIGVAGLGIMARQMAVTVQDRVIRLEMRLRLAELLPADLKARSGELTKGQLVGLRFASDGEVAGLVARCLNGELKNGEAVKREIKTWVPDTLRC